MLNEITMGVRDYILSGKSDFTILQESVGEKPRVACRYTVKLSPKKENVYFVYTQDVISHRMVYHGYFTVYRGTYKYLRAKTTKTENYNEKAIRALLWVLQRADHLPALVHIIPTGRWS